MPYITWGVKSNVVSNFIISIFIIKGLLIGFLHISSNSTNYPGRCYESRTVARVLHYACYWILPNVISITVPVERYQVQLCESQRAHRFSCKSKSESVSKVLGLSLAPRQLTPSKTQDIYIFIYVTKYLDQCMEAIASGLFQLHKDHAEARGNNAF